MKKNTFIITFLLLCSTALNAQTKRDSREKIKVLKIAHITEQLNLTETEAEKFWPLYNEFDTKMHNLRSEERFKLKKKIKQLGGLDALNEKNAKEILENILTLEKALYKTKYTFFSKLSSVLSYKKIIKLEIAEKEFNRKLLKKYRGKHNKK